jgi:hypothetical protein
MILAIFVNKLCIKLAKCFYLLYSINNLVLQLLLVQDGKLYGRDTFLTICARSLALDVSKNHGLHTNEYILQLNQLMVNLLKILCANTPWQRRKLGKILNDWSVFHVQVIPFVPLLELYYSLLNYM